MKEESSELNSIIVNLREENITFVMKRNVRIYRMLPIFRSVVSQPHYCSWLPLLTLRMNTRCPIRNSSMSLWSPHSAALRYAQISLFTENNQRYFLPFFVLFYKILQYRELETFTDAVKEQTVPLIKLILCHCPFIVTFSTRYGTTAILAILWTRWL